MAKKKEKTVKVELDNLIKGKALKEIIQKFGKEIQSKVWYQISIRKLCQKK